MKKFTLSLCLLCATLFATAQTTIFSEDFSNITTNTAVDNNGNQAGGTDISANLDSKIGSTLTGWTGLKVYEGNGMLKVGTSSVMGFLATPPLNLQGSISISVDLRSWNNTGDLADTGSSIDVLIDNTVVGTIDYNTVMATYTVQNITAGTATSKIQFAAKVPKNRFFIDNIIVTSGSAPVSKVATPVITPATSTVTAPTSVSISTSTAGAAIYYTLDGTTPTTSSNLYSAPFTVSATTTVKAIATAAGLTNSDVATSVITFGSATNSVANIAAFVAATTDNEYTITGSVSVVYQDAAKRNMYIKDATGWLLIFSNPALTESFSNGDVLTGLQGTLSTYQGAAQMTNATTPTAATGAAVNPIVSTTSSLTTADVAKFVKIENVQFSSAIDYTATPSTNGLLTDGTVVRDNFRIGGAFTTGTAYTITGFVAVYQNNVQIYPIAIVPYIPSANDNHTANALSIYTNNDFLMISVESGTSAEIYSTTGANVLSTTVENGSINISSLNKGVYMLRVGAKTAKFVK